MDVTATKRNKVDLREKPTENWQKKSSEFSIELFSEYQNRMSSYLLCRRAPLKPGPQTALEDPATLVLTGRDSVLIGPTAFLSFILIAELESLASAPELTAATISTLLNRHSRAGLPIVERVLALGVGQGLLKCKEGSNEQSPAFSCSENLHRLLADCENADPTESPAERALSTEREHDAMSESSALGVQIKRAYLAHKSGQVDYVLETTAVALKALRSKEISTHQTILDQKVLLLSLRARALMQIGQANASDACMQAAIKCMAVSATRHPLPS